MIKWNKSRGSRRKFLLVAAFVVLIVTLCFGLWFGLGVAERKRESEAIRERLPAIPDTKGWPAAFSEAFREAESGISWRGDALESVKEYAMLFHANGYLEEAASCYLLLEEREPREPRWPYLQALVHLDRGDLASGQALLESVISLSPNTLHALLKLGDVRFKSNQSESALEAYRKSLRLDKDNPYALLGMAREKMRRGDAGEALPLLTRLVENNPEFGPGHRLLAQLYDRNGETRRAEVSRALGEKQSRYQEPPDPWMEEVMSYCYDVHRLTVLADTQRQPDRIKQALLYLDQAEAVAPDSPIIHTIRGFRLSELGDSDAAIESFESAIRLTGHSTDAYNGLARVYVALRDYAKAIETARRGLAEFPASRKFHSILGEFLLQQGDLAEAERHLRIALGKDPNETKTIKSFANLLLKQGHEAEAMDKFEKLRRLAPLDGYSRVTLAQHYVKQGEFEKAEAPIREAQELEPEDPKLRSLTVDILIANGNRKAAAGQLPDAVATLREAVRLDPTRLDLFRSMALIHAGLQEWDAAAENLKTYLDRYPGDAKTWVILGDVYWSAKDLSEARARWLHAERLAGEQNGADDLLAIIDARLGQLDQNP